MPIISPTSPIPAPLESVAHGPAGSPLPHLMRGVWIQAVRRKEFYVVGILMALYMLAALVLRIVGIETPQTARFIAGLGFQLASLLASLLVIIMSCRMVPLEMELRTIYPILAKPVSRSQFLLGKSFPTLLVGSMALALFVATTLLITPRLPYQQAGVLAQALVLKTLALAILTAMAFWMSLWMPSAMAVLITGIVYFTGGTLAGVATQLAHGAAWSHWLAALIPDLRLLDQFQRYVDGGGALGDGVFLGLIAYGLLWVLIFGGLARLRFERLEL